MKLPFEFGIKLLFRLVFPGLIFAAAMVPLVHWGLHALGMKIKVLYLFPFEAILWGWLFFICDMHIYMLFEGRCYWLRQFRELFLWI